MPVDDSANLFRHVSAEKAALYRSVMDVFAAAKRQYRLQLRPDEVLAEARWNGATPPIEDITAALAQLAAWGNLEMQPDTARVSSLADFYRARFLYRLSHGGEAVEAALATFEQTMRRRAELQTVALEDIAARLQALFLLVVDTAAEPDVVKIHETLRDLVRVFEGLAERALGLTVPLFAAIASFYGQGSYALAPRLMLLDEAFAGIDDAARAHCMALIREFDLDFVITSEREWVCYAELPGVFICQLQKLPDVDAIYVSRWTWDGRARWREADPERRFPAA